MPEQHRQPSRERSSIDYSGLVKRLRLPPSGVIPTELTYDGLVARAITRADLHDDVRGINASVALIQATRGGGWPTEPVTDDYNYVDLVWHELEFREGDSFTYVVRDASGGYLGCCYFYPMGRRTPLTEGLLIHDVDVSWWVTPDAYERGYYGKLYHALRQWATQQLPFTSPHFSNVEIPPEC